MSFEIQSSRDAKLLKITIMQTPPQKGTDDSIHLQIEFEPTEISVAEIMQFKGLVNYTQALDNYETYLILDADESVSLVYQSGRVSLEFHKGKSKVVIPVDKKYYTRLDKLLEHWL